MKETQVTAKLVKFLNQIPNSHFYKAHGGKFKSGHPDVTGTWCGRGISGEVKMPNNYLTALQAVELDARRRAGEVTWLAMYQPTYRNFFVLRPRGEPEFTWHLWADRRLPKHIDNRTPWDVVGFEGWQEWLRPALTGEPTVLDWTKA